MNVLKNKRKGAAAWIYFVVIALIVGALLLMAIIQGKGIVADIMGKIAEILS